jgi:hypothetical protein
LDDLVLDHDIPHLWLLKNSLSDSKNPSQHSLRAAAGCVAGGGPRTTPTIDQAKNEWLMPQYASEIDYTWYTTRPNN